MDDTPVSSAQEFRPWLLLIHQLPIEPAYVRVKVRRRLQRLGAVALKSSVYVLPHTDEHVEDFQWLAREIVADGGEATLCSATLLAGATDRDLAARFPELGAGGVVATPAREARPRPRGATWVTRQGIAVDRIASAWLILNCIDPAARFRFVADSRGRKRSGEIRFDMYHGEFTHAGERCTFETLLWEFGLDEAPLQAIGEIVHDIDCKDEKFGRPEVTGVRAAVLGVTRATTDDRKRLELGSTLFDGLYASLGGRGATDS